MAREFLWHAPVWQADVDAYGDVRNVSLLRLLQEVATRASSDAGFDARYYERTGTMWLIRRTRITLGSPARCGDVLAVRTWIADFRRVRSQREYTVHAGDRPVAQAFSDWVFIDGGTGRPRRIPPEWESRFMPEGLTTIKRTAFPEADAPANAPTFHRRVELHELDALRHVNNSNYVSYLEQATLDLLDAVGWGFEAQQAAGGRFRAISHDLEYLDAALYGERIAITIWPTDLTATTVEHHVHLYRGDPHRPLLQARSRYAWTTSTGELSMPNSLRSALLAP